MYFKKNKEIVEINLKTGKIDHAGGLSFVCKKLKEIPLTMNKIDFIESKGYSHIG